MKFNIEYDLEIDGRWIAEIPSIPGAMIYGFSKIEAAQKVISLVLEIIADNIEINNSFPEYLEISYAN